MDEKIKAALAALDPKKNDDWTNAGLPSMDRMKELTGLSDLTRAEVSAVAPGFHQANAGAAPSELENVGSGPTAPDGSAPSDDAPPQAAGTNDGELYGEGNLPDDPTVPTPDVIAAAVADPIVLLEAFVIAASTDRYRRNNAMMNFVRSYQVEQGAIREMQKRLDLRAADREVRNAEAIKREADKR